MASNTLSDYISWWFAVQHKPGILPVGNMDEPKLLWKRWYTLYQARPCHCTPWPENGNQLALLSNIQVRQVRKQMKVNNRQTIRLELSRKRNFFFFNAFNLINRTQISKLSQFRNRWNMMLLYYVIAYT